MFSSKETRKVSLSDGKRTLNDTFNRFATIPACPEPTDGQTDGRNCHIAHCIHDWMRTCDKNGHLV